MHECTRTYGCVLYNLNSYASARVLTRAFLMTLTHALATSCATFRIFFLKPLVNPLRCFYVNVQTRRRTHTYGHAGALTEFQSYAQYGKYSDTRARARSHAY